MALTLLFGAAVRRAIFVALAAIGCGGALDEDEGGANPLIDDLTPPVCAEPVAGGDGHHRPGEDCLACHRQGGDGPPFAIAGTLYTDRGGTAPAVGVTLHVLDGAGADVAMVSATNGNFWSVDGVIAPAVAFTARCPDVVAMRAPLAAADASCNRSGCHTAGFRVAP